MVETGNKEEPPSAVSKAVWYTVVGVSVIGLLAPLLYFTSSSMNHWMAHYCALALTWAKDAPVTVATGLVFLTALFVVALVPSTPLEVVIALAYGLNAGFWLVFIG